MTTTVARYLAKRLRELNITHVFGVPGNHLCPFLTAMHEAPGLRWVGTPTEIGAGYAADAYARVRTGPRVGVAAVTYSVGAFNLLNPIGGAYVENVPIIAINASPTYEQWLNYRAIGLLTSHMSERRESNLEVFRQVTVDAQVITNAALAPVQIDSAIVACLSERRPVYLEVMEDVWDASCDCPIGTLAARHRPVTDRNRTILARAADAAVRLIGELGTPILWAGEEVDRFDLAGEFTELVEQTGIPFCSTIGGKAVVSEDHPDFVGVYNGKASDPRVYEVFKELAKVRIGIGSWSTSKNLGGELSIGPDWIVAAREGVSVGTAYFPDVKLPAFVDALRQRLVERFGHRRFEADYYAMASQAGLPVPVSTTAYRRTLLSTEDDLGQLSYDGLFRRVSAFLSRQPNRYTVVSDAGFALLGSMSLHMSEQDSYLAQNSWLSIGYSIGAATGIGLARSDRRPLVFVGDGSFQETAQEVSTHVRLGLRPVIFVLDNEAFYGIEQMLVAPCYYTKPPLREEDHYNVLHPWRYAALAEVFATEKSVVTGVEIADYTDLDALLSRIGDDHDPINGGPVLVHLRLARDDYPRAIGYKVDECLA